MSTDELISAATKLEKRCVNRYLRTNTYRKRDDFIEEHDRRHVEIEDEVLKQNKRAYESV